MFLIYKNPDIYYHKKILPLKSVCVCVWGGGGMIVHINPHLKFWGMYTHPHAIYAPGPKEYLSDHVHLC